MLLFEPLLIFFEVWTNLSNPWLINDGIIAYVLVKVVRLVISIAAAISDMNVAVSASTIGQSSMYMISSKLVE